MNGAIHNLAKDDGNKCFASFLKKCYNLPYIDKEGYMKKIVITLLLISSNLLVGCNKIADVAKLDDKQMNMFPSSVKVILEDANPDIVSMDYLEEHAKDYAIEFETDRNDYFVILKGTVTDVNIIDYSKEDLSILDNEDKETLLKDIISYEYYIDESKSYINTSINIGEKEPDIDDGKEYYFFIIVNEIGNDYVYNIVDYFNLN